MRIWWISRKLRDDLCVGFLITVRIPVPVAIVAPLEQGHGRGLVILVGEWSGRSVVYVGSDRLCNKCYEAEQDPEE